MPKKEVGKSKKTLKKATLQEMKEDIEAPDLGEPGIPVQEEFYQIPTRFGTVPVDKEPLGWDKDRRFEKIYPKVSLPFQIVERVSFGNPELEPNRLFFGDNLHIMRALPSESIDLIYIDPPFFSGRQYNVLFGDKNELRSFADVWEGGMPGYLVWLNARLYEMKRLLKKNGSIYVHLYLHAAHYVKVEMDKIFGYENFRNEIIWCYTGPSQTRRYFPRKHDTILFYSKGDQFKFFPDEVRVGYVKSNLATGSSSIIRRKTKEEIKELDERGKLIEDWWGDIATIGYKHSEIIGYPTQKPEALLERIIKASSDRGDVVADFFCGGGTTPTVAQKLNRHWIASDISRIAVALTADRIAKRLEQSEDDKKSMQLSLGKINPAPDFTVEHWGVYEIKKLSKIKPLEFRKFAIEAYDGRPDTTHKEIHGYKKSTGEPLYVGSPDPDERVTKGDVIAFSKAILTKKGLHRGTMLAWAFAPEARTVAEKLASREGISLDFVRLSLVPIDSPGFRMHVAEKHPAYTDLLTFVLPPSIRLGIEQIKGLKYRFDISESVSMNPEGKIVNAQWDFDYKGKFTSTRGYSFLRGSKQESLLTAEYTFQSAGRRTIACRVQDDVGGEGTLIREINIK